LYNGGMEIATKIQEIRKKSGLTQKELADRLFVTRQAVTRWENGDTTPTIETLKSIAELFNVDGNILLGTNQHVCQSCSAPLASIDYLGTNSDKSASTDYCKHCFVDGKFIAYETVDDAIADSVNYAQYAGLTKEEMLAFARENYPNLKRWRKDEYPTKHFAEYQEALNLHDFDVIAKLFHKDVSFFHSGVKMTDPKEVEKFHLNFWNTIKGVKWWATDVKILHQDDKCEIYTYQYNYSGTVDGEKVEGNGRTTDVFVKNPKSGKWEFLHAHSSSETPNHDD